MGGRGSPRRAAGRRAQATIEFAFVAPLFFLCFFAAIDAGLWAIQTSASVSAAEQAARLAAAAAASPQSEDTPSPEVLFSAIRHQLGQAMFGTRVVAWCDPSGGACATPVASTATSAPFAHCPVTPDQVEQRFGARTVAVCDETSALAPACPAPPLPATPRCGDPPTVTVRVIGFLASLVPPLSGLGWRGGEIPIDIVATTHTLRFAP
ncbi:MAG TPA: TadE family protein [Candidatus Dormibacteraeota bacterium]|jgi:Flp pilus assembly protein TadG|nr:TadE family protein [Candidatus Dormibacteraeota bacterium]